MKAELLFERKFSVTTKTGCVVTIFMDLYLLPPKENETEEQYKFGWIAFDSEDSTRRVLFDCHYPKGPHVHIGHDKEEILFPWEGFEQALNLFFSTVAEYFGEFDWEI